MLMLFLILLLPPAVQWAGYYIAKKRKTPAIRWIVFWASMLLFYTALFIAYGKAAAYYDARQQCGMWVIGYFIMGCAGLLMPLMQLSFSVFEWYKQKKQRRDSDNLITELDG